MFAMRYLSLITACTGIYNLIVSRLEQPHIRPLFPIFGRVYVHPLNAHETCTHGYSGWAYVTEFSHLCW